MSGELGGKWGKVWKRGEWGKCESVANKSLINLLLQLPWWVRMLFGVLSWCECWKSVVLLSGQVTGTSPLTKEILWHCIPFVCYIKSNDNTWLFRKGKWFPTPTFPFYSYNRIGFWATKNSFINNAFGFIPRLWILFSWLKLCWHQFGGKRQFQIEPAATPILSWVRCSSMCNDWCLRYWTR